MLYGTKMRLTSLILACILFLSLLSGCGSNATNSTPPSAEPIEPTENVDPTNPTPEPEIAPVASPEVDSTAEQPVTSVGEEEPAETPDPIAQAQAEAEERARAEEEARRQAEEERKRAEQLNSFAMMYYLAITAEEIRTSHDNRLILDDIYTSLLNDINPGAIDEITQDHLKNLRDIIKSYLLISTKRDRLQFIYNQEKAAAIRSAVPNPLAILSMANSLDWKKLAMSVVYTAVDSYTSYKSASENADMNFLMSGWELDDEEVATVQKNRDRAFDYMVDMVQEYHLDGMLTLNERAISEFAEICNIESPYERISRLVDEEKTYQLLGNYWLELADCYFETSQYAKCLSCIAKYNELAAPIYRSDFNYASILPKAIVAAQMTYNGDEYISKVRSLADDLLNNTSNKDWSSRYFLAQVYLDLYTKTDDQSYLEKAYRIARSNVTILLKEQRALNQTYLDPVQELTAAEPDYRFLSEQEKKEKEKEYKEEQKRVKAYNKELNETRKTELPALYEPLILNCELLFALAEKLGISDTEKRDLEAILGTETNGIFLSKPINDAYSFSNRDNRYTLDFSGDALDIPANLLTAGSTITITVNENGSSVTFDDCVITKVEREGKTIDTFIAHITSKQLKKYDWTADSRVVITITYGDAYDRTVTFNFKVSEFQEHWYGDKVVFVQE